MTPDQIREIQALRDSRQSLLGQIRGLVTKCDRLQDEVKRAKAEQVFRENAAFRAGWDDAIESVRRMLDERFTKPEEGSR